MVTRLRGFLERPAVRIVTGHELRKELRAGIQRLGARIVFSNMVPLGPNGRPPISNVDPTKLTNVHMSSAAGAVPVAGSGSAASVSTATAPVGYLPDQTAAKSVDHALIKFSKRHPAPQKALIRYGKLLLKTLLVATFSILTTIFGTLLVTLIVYIANLRAKGATAKEVNKLANDQNTKEALAYQLTKIDAAAVKRVLEKIKSPSIKLALDNLMKAYKLADRLAMVTTLVPKDIDEMRGRLASLDPKMKVAIYLQARLDATAPPLPILADLAKPDCALPIFLTAYADGKTSDELDSNKVHSAVLEAIKPRLAAGAAQPITLEQLLAAAGDESTEAAKARGTAALAIVGELIPRTIPVTAKSGGQTLRAALEELERISHLSTIAKAIIGKLPPKGPDPLIGVQISGTIKIGGKTQAYKIIEQIGKGGMATVYKVERESDHKIFAIKILNDEIVENDDLRGRFIKSFEVLQAIQQESHTPYVIMAFDAGTTGHKVSGLDQPFIILEYADGGTLKSQITSIHSSTAPEIVKQIARGLMAAFNVPGRKFAHRDVKPDNVLIVTGADGQPIYKLTDFDLAKDFSDDKTRAAIAMGTTSFMAPECLDSKTVDYRADIYALGILFFQLLANKKPFDYDNNSWARLAAEALGAIRAGQDLSQFMIKDYSDVPGKYKALIQKMTHPDRTKRYQSYETLIEDLTAICSGKKPASGERASSIWLDAANIVDLGEIEKLAGLDIAGLDLLKAKQTSQRLVEILTILTESDEWYATLSRKQESVEARLHILSNDETRATAPQPLAAQIGKLEGETLRQLLVRILYAKDPDKAKLEGQAPIMDIDSAQLPAINAALEMKATSLSRTSEDVAISELIAQLNIEITDEIERNPK